MAVFPPPPVQGLGTMGGFKMELEDRAGLGEAELFEATQALLGQATRRRSSPGSSPASRSTCPSSEVDVDRER